MQIALQVKQEVTNEKKLRISLQGKFATELEISKVRLLLHFYDGCQDRLYPLASEYMLAEKQPDGRGTYVASGFGEISLPYVFLYGSNQEKIWVVPELFYGKERVVLENHAFVLEGKYFARTRSQRLGKKLRNQINAKEISEVPKKDYGQEGIEAFHLSAFDCKVSIGVKLHRFVMKLAAVYMLPQMLVDGYVALKGYQDLVLEGKKASGKKAIIFHANNKIKRFTGVTFSLRQFKTDYFARKYAKYRKKPVVANQILMLSERKVEENGNLDLVRAGLREQGNIKVVEFLNTKKVDALSFKELRKAARFCATSKVIVLEDFYPQFHKLDVREETKVVQLWHACGAFKTFGFSRLGKQGGPEEESGNHRSYDYAFVSGEKLVPYYSEAFAIPESHVLPLGVPRTDIFFDPDYKRKMQEKWYQKFPEWKGKRLVLFAPTFRGDGNRDAYYPMERLEIENFMKQMPEDVVLLIKHHPFVKEQMQIPEAYKNRVFNLTKGAAINELLFLTDVLITDYSSSVFEASLLQIPMLFYVFDKAQYMEERDIYGDFDCFVPGAQVMEQEELAKKVCETLEHPSESLNLEEFKEMYVSALDGNSTKRIVDFIASF